MSKATLPMRVQLERLNIKPWLYFGSLDGSRYQLVGLHCGFADEMQEPHSAKHDRTNWESLGRIGPNTIWANCRSTIPVRES